MRRFLLSLLSLVVCFTAFAEETQESRRARRGEGSLMASRDATTLSMVGWGFGIAIGLAAICAMIEDHSSEGSSSSSSNSH